MTKHNVWGINLDSSIPEDYWRECVTFYNRPVHKFKQKFGETPLPMEAYMDGYGDDMETDAGHVATYSDFEDKVLNDDILNTFQENVLTGKAYVKNNIFIDTTRNTGMRTINRVHLNYNDGYIQNSVINGNGIDKDALEPNWFDTVDVNSPENKDMHIMVPKVYANCISDVVFPANEIHTSDYFFTERDRFIDAFSDNPEFAGASALAIDKAMHPELIGYKSNINGIYAFNDMMSYCNYTGSMFADISSMILMLTYFAHNVLTILLPKKITLIMDSTSGVSIPVKYGEYEPSVMRKYPNGKKYFNYSDIPDYQNKLDHVIYMMKEIASGKMFTYRVGQFYLKMTITPALTIINFVQYASQNVRLILSIPTVDNQILDESENMSIYPRQFTEAYTPYWHTGRDHRTSKDVLQSISNNYHSRLLGMDGGELEEFMRVNSINIDDNQFNPYIAPQMNVQHPSDLNYYL